MSEHPGAWCRIRLRRAGHHRVTSHRHVITSEPDSDMSAQARIQVVQVHEIGSSSSPCSSSSRVRCWPIIADAEARLSDSDLPSPCRRNFRVLPVSSLAWIHDLYLKACGPPGPTPPSRGRPNLKAHYRDGPSHPTQQSRRVPSKGGSLSLTVRLPARARREPRKQHPPPGRAVRLGGRIKERNNRESPERRP